MTRNEFKKRDKENKISLLDGALNEIWYSIIPMMTNLQNGKYSEDEMTEIYALFSEFKETIKKYN